MKITDREKIMLIVLGLLGVFALSYFLLFSPQFDRIAELTGEESEYLQKVADTKAQVESIDKLEADVDSLVENLADKTAPYYPEIIQEKLIVIMDGIVVKTGVDLQTMSFGMAMISAPPTAQQTGALVYPLKEMVDNYLAFKQGKPAGSDGTQQPSQNPSNTGEASDAVQIQSIDITMHIEGACEQWVAFIVEMEALKRMMTIDNLSASLLEDDKVSSDIQVKFFALPKVDEQDTDYLDWPYKGVYGKENLFTND